MKKWFGVTLIEVIFAIIIFGAGILVILRMVTTNIGWIYEIKNKDTALSIAKEGLDIVYHIRDSNLERGQYWDCAQIDMDATDACGRYFYDGSDPTKHIINFSQDGMYSMEQFTTTGDARLYYHTGSVSPNGMSGSTEGFWYDHSSSGGDQTIYWRILEFTPVTGYEAQSGFVLHVTSRVLYGKNHDDEIALESIIGNIR